ncbi:MAG TPA: chitobiase/beta-hexosaminidase C-terminal domain-containing protein, partial [Thermoguttaceae bacterium]|nr:chitobiase/beta-hexosaminidase C-terminal domain-containing protein [Thermoguttaceae bacterium]
NFNTATWSGSRQVLITEAGTGAPDYVEIQNVSANAVDTTGWFLAVNIGTVNNINSVTSTYWNLPSSMAPGALTYATDRSSADALYDPAHDFGAGISWSTTGNGWAMIHDGVGEVIDFVAWGAYDAADIASLNTTVNGFQITGADLWTGIAIPFLPNTSAVERVGNVDNNDAGDFQTIDPVTPTLPNLGVQNPNLTTPFSASPGSGATTGVGFSANPADFAAAIQTDVADEMLGVNGSLWMRSEFDVQDPADFDLLQLRMQYNDGFVAYLNGQPIASRNAPGSPTWDSTATAGRSVADSMIYEEINVSGGLAHLQAGTNLLAIHGLNNGVADPNFLIRPELVGTSTQGLQRFFATPSPGYPNDSGFVNFVGDTKFSVGRGFFDTPFQVSISTATPGATIYYTTDGSVPSIDNGQIYTGPLTVSTTTTLRAFAWKEGFEPTNVDTQTYIRTADVARQVRPDGYPTAWGGESSADYDVDQSISLSAQYADRFLEGLTSIPTLSIVLPMEDFFGPTGLYSNTLSTTLEKAVSAEFIYADGREGFQVEAGLKMQGGASRGVEASIKHSMSLRFRQIYGDGRLDFPLFENWDMDRFNSIQLRAMYNNSWIHRDSSQRQRAQMIRDQWARDSLIAMGQEDAGQGRFVNVYINGVFWGVHDMQERQEAAHYAQYNGIADDVPLDALNGGQPND